MDAFQIRGKSVKREHPKTQRRKGLAQITQHSPENDGLGLLFLKPELFPHSSASFSHLERLSVPMGSALFPGQRKPGKLGLCLLNVSCRKITKFMPITHLFVVMQSFDYNIFPPPKAQVLKIGVPIHTTSGRWNL